MNDIDATFISSVILSLFAWMVMTLKGKDHACDFSVVAIKLQEACTHGKHDRSDSFDRGE